MQRAVVGSFQEVCRSCCRGGFVDHHLAAVRLEEDHVLLDFGGARGLRLVDIDHHRGRRRSRAAALCCR